MEPLDWEHFAQCSFKQEHQLSKTHEIQILILGMALNFFLLHVVGLSVPHPQTSSEVFSLVYVSSLQVIFPCASYCKKTNQ